MNKNLEKTADLLDRMADRVTASSLTRTIKQVGVPAGDGYAVGVPFAVLTAYRADQDRQTNATRSMELFDAIEAAGLDQYKLHGEWADPEGNIMEESFFVTGDAEDFKDTVKRLAGEFQQPAFLFSDGKALWVETEAGPQTIGSDIGVKEIERGYKKARNQSSHDFAFAEKKK